MKHAQTGHAQTRHAPASPGQLRIEEVDTALVLPQILRLRAIVARRVSLAPDVTSWLDPLDARAMHWGVFQDAELVAAARLCVHASLDEMADAALFRSHAAGLRGPVAAMSRCVVHPRLCDLRLESALDLARIERVRQLRLGAVLTVARSARRLVALEAEGFDALEPADDGRIGLVLHVAPERHAQQVRMRVPSRT